MRCSFILGAQRHTNIDAECNTQGASNLHLKSNPKENRNVTSINNNATGKNEKKINNYHLLIHRTSYSKEGSPPCGVTLSSICRAYKPMYSRFVQTIDYFLRFWLEQQLTNADKISRLARQMTSTHRKYGTPVLGPRIWLFSSVSVKNFTSLS